MSLIYKPSGQAREYAASACNVYSGCDHDCIYCYAPNATHKTREQFSKPIIRANFLENLERETLARKRNGVPPGRVLLCFTCDPYSRLDIVRAHTREAIKILHRAGNTVQILTKGGTRALRDLDLFTTADAFATTMTLLDNAQSRTWEPRAALPGDRIEALKQFHAAGVPTWVSLEPVLDPHSALEIIRVTHSFADLYKVGKLNYHPLAQTIDWRKFAADVVALLESLGARYYIKHSLLPYLPGLQQQNPDEF